jgi:hypothetical protein
MSRLPYKKDQARESLSLARLTNFCGSLVLRDYLNLIVCLHPELTASKTLLLLAMPQL